MATVICTKCHNPMQTNKAPGELEDCPNCKAIFEIPYNKAKFYHHSLPGMRQPSNEASVLSIFGSICLVIGLLVMGYFFLFYDTSVYGGSGIGYVHNISKGNNRTAGMVFGGFVAIVGTGLLIADQAKKK